MLDSAFPAMPRHITDLPEGPVALTAHPERLIPLLETMGSLVAATANPACRIARTGPYRDYQGGAHAAMVFHEAVDLRFFPAHWVQARAVMAEGARAIHVFDAAGDAVHCITATEGTDRGRWADLVASLATDAPTPPLAERPAPEAPRANPARAGELRADWNRMTDTHQFLRLVARLKMNRLGAYRIAGEPHARALLPDAVARLLGAASADGLPVMAFVGNRGCIQIHGGPIPGLALDGDRLTVRNPDLSFDLDCARIAEVWAVTKPTRAGPAVSVEFFEADGSLIAQLFGMRRAGEAAVAAWEALVATETTAGARA
ncbi:ChuX/HutX family heme-like substrate-binding protein [Cereibacter sediminicola]|uniref:ChuX/HutX family heme-like substrate-binding protein n=1 Tax=Cereibacter sediminicola TaxID=2584941 RepID=UPI001642CD03|nr:ChuX/HutX family heme-like substrate-binding protein [Cereibacter sediminicola]